jgi:hypothetical protein
VFRSCCRALQDLEKVVAVMHALDVTQPLAETLLDSHNGCIFSAVEAALDGVHG